MKKLITVSAIALMTATAGFAQGISTSGDESHGQSNVLGANNNYEQSVDQSTTVTHEAGSGTTTVTNETINHKPNGYINNPNLTTSGQDTCFGSKSGGISGPGFGISGGETIVDENCVMIKQAKLLTQLGLKDAAVLLLINSDDDLAAAIWGAYPDLADVLTSVKE